MFSRIFRIFLFLLILLSGKIVSPGYVQDFHWEFSGWEGGGCFPNIEPDPNTMGRIYLTSDVSGLWRSDDRGNHWHFANKGLKNLNVAAIAISPFDSNVLYAATAGGVYMSRDAGNSWSVISNPNRKITFQRPQSYRPIAVSPQNPLKLCIASMQGEVFCSQDGGKIWLALEMDRQKSLSAVIFDQSGEKLYAGGSSGLQIYDFTSKSLSKINTDLKDLTDLVMSNEEPARLYAAAGGEMWISADLGASWRKSSENHKGKIFRLAITTSEGKKVFAAVNDGWNGSIVFSDDEGKSWKNAVKSLHPDKSGNPTRNWAALSGKLTALKFDPFEKNIVYRSDWWGIFRSDDGGKTWDEKIRGAPNTVISDIAFLNDSLLVGSMDNGLLKSEDAGKNFRALFPSDHYDTDRAGHVWRVINPKGANIIATSSPWNKAVNQVIVSDDGGVNFKISREGLPDKRPSKNTMWGQGYPRALAFDPSNPDRIYLGIDGDDGGGLFISDDGGLSWKRSESQPGSLRIFRALAVDPTDPKRIFWGACGNGGGIYVSEDEGQTWRQSFKEISWIFDIKISPDGIIYAAGDYSGNSAIYISKDHGKTWQRSRKAVFKGAASTLAIDPQDPQKVAFSTTFWNQTAPAKVYLSTDGGMNWQEASGDLPDNTGASVMAFSPDGQFLYVGLYAGSVYRMKM